MDFSTTIIHVSIISKEKLKFKVNLVFPSYEEISLLLYTDFSPENFKKNSFLKFIVIDNSSPLKKETKEEIIVHLTPIIHKHIEALNNQYNCLGEYHFKIRKIDDKSFYILQHFDTGVNSFHYIKGKSLSFDFIKLNRNFDYFLSSVDEEYRPDDHFYNLFTRDKKLALKLLTL